MFNFFKKSQLPTDLSFIETDIHSHLLFGLDDGAENLEQSLYLIEKMASLGYKKLITTPHIHSDFHPNNPANILEKYAIVNEVLQEKQIPIQLRASAEYMIDEGFMQLLENNMPLLTLFDNKILVEMSYLAESPFLGEAMFTLETKGFTPILAHPERYNFYHNNHNSYIDLKDKGYLFQLNTIALTGYYGSHVKRTAEKLLADNMYEYCGTDMHHKKHYHALSSILKNTKLLKKLSAYPFRNPEISW